MLARIDYARLRQLKNGIYALLMVSILAVLARATRPTASQRAISLPFFSFQASELGKVLLILALSAFVVDRSRRLRERETTARVMLAALVPAMFVIAQPDLGSGMVYMVIAFMLLFVAGTPWRQLAALVALVVRVRCTLVLAAAPGGRRARAQALPGRTPDGVPAPPRTRGNQGRSKTGEPSYLAASESKIAIGAGQKTGRGANATQIRLNFVPEDDTDFVFAAVGEQYGFVGAALVLSPVRAADLATLRILTMSKDLFGALVAAGVVAMLMFQVFVNVGMTIGIMPITGVTLPLMSYGGSSVIATLLAVGLLQSIYVRARACGCAQGPRATVLRHDNYETGSKN